jgi:DNA (cytosine-5)-methyltransferase 1
MRAVDLFCGCGGLSLGLEKAGFEIAKAYDAWEAAIKCYRLNFDHPVSSVDLSDVDGAVSEICPLVPDIIVGGPPCQDFSHAGKRHEGNRADLTKAFAEIITSVRPQWFLMENVARAKKSLVYSQARKTFISAGYGLTEIVLDASFCGVPQKRKRFFCIGKLGESVGFLDALLAKSQASEAMTVRQFLGEELAVEHYYRHPRNYSRRAVYSIDEPAPTIRGVNRPVPAGYGGHHCDTVSSDEVRALTTLERARIQTFPKSFKWTGTKTDLEQIIGNAVPVNLAKFVGKVILTYQNIVQESEIALRAISEQQAA